MENGLDLGRVVYSNSGRDAGRYYIIIGLPQENYVLIADGTLRKLGKPKLKKLKHLEIKKDCLSTIGEKLQDGRKVFDSEVRAGLESLGYYQRDKEKGVEGSD